MSSFVYENYVEEFAYRTKLNYYNLMIGQVSEALKTATQKEDDIAIKDCTDKILGYKEKINTLTSEMIFLGYSVNQFYEVTQLINSLVGLLIFPKQVYDGLLDRDQNEANIKKDLPTVWRIISNDKDFAFTYKGFQKTAEGIEELAKNRAAANEIEIILSGEFDRKQRKELNRQRNQLNLTKREIETQLFKNLPPRSLSTYTIVQHMRNAVAHKHLSVFPEEKNQRIEAIIIKDVGEGKIKYSENGMPYDLQYEYREKENSNDPRYGVFQLRIGVNDLEEVLMEICNLILGIAKNANET